MVLEYQHRTMLGKIPQHDDNRDKLKKVSFAA
jgi:hypothetical protein